MSHIMDESKNKDISQYTARRMLEIAENKKEIAMSLYKYMGPVMVAPQCMLCPGDYMVYKNQNMISARGASIPMDVATISSMIASRTFDKVFDPADINAPNFDTVIDRVFETMNIQKNYQDAAGYYCHNHEDKGLAAYVSEQDPKKIISVVERKNDTINVMNLTDMPQTRIDMLFHDMRECTYQEFNPGGKDLHEMMAKTINPETQNKGSAYEKLQKEYIKSGQNDVKSLDEIQADKNMSPIEKLRAVGESLDDSQAEAAKQALLAQEFMPKLPGTHGFHDV